MTAAFLSSRAHIVKQPSHGCGDQSKLTRSVSFEVAHLVAIAAQAHSCGRQPAEKCDTALVSREAATDFSRCHRFAAGRFVSISEPWADAHGYLLSSLRD